MRIEQALDFIHASNAAQFESLSDLLPPKLITTLLGEEGVVIMRHRACPWSTWSGPSSACPSSAMSAGQSARYPFAYRPFLYRPQRLPASSPKTRVQEHQEAVSRNRSTLALGVQSQRVMVHYWTLIRRMHFGSRSSWLSPHNTENSSRAPSVERVDAQTCRSIRIERQDRR